MLPALQQSPACSPARDAGAALSLSRRSTACLDRPSLPAALAARRCRAGAVPHTRLPALGTQARSSRHAAQPPQDAALQRPCSPNTGWGGGSSCRDGHTSRQSLIISEGAGAVCEPSSSQPCSSALLHRKLAVRSPQLQSPLLVPVSKSMMEVEITHQEQEIPAQVSWLRRSLPPSPLPRAVPNQQLRGLGALPPAALAQEQCRARATCPELHLTGQGQPRGLPWSESSQQAVEIVTHQGRGHAGWWD